MKRPTLTQRILSIWEHWLNEREKRRVLETNKRTFVAVLRDAQETGGTA